MVVANPYSSLPLVEGTDRLVLIVRDQIDPDGEIEHWLWHDLRVQVRRVTPDALEQWIVSGDRSGVQWLVQGKIVRDESGFLGELRRRLDEWPVLLREQKLLCEFSRFFLTYMYAKRDMQNGQAVDAYSHVLASLHHWAHIALVEEGMLPETTVWEQMRRVNPGIYKLYEVLTSSSETLEKRVQLVILACEFSVLTNMKSSCALLMRVLGDRKEPWTLKELSRDARLRALPIDLSLLLRKLVHRGLVREVAIPVRGSEGMHLELRYAPGD